MIFPGLSVPTGPLAAAPLPATERCGDKTVMMPKRQRTRAQSRTAAITAERRANREHRTIPTQPYKADEDFTYEETFTQEPIPPPF